MERNHGLVLRLDLFPVLAQGRMKPGLVRGPRHICTGGIFYISISPLAGRGAADLRGVFCFLETPRCTTELTLTLTKTVGAIWRNLKKVPKLALSLSANV